MIKQEQRYTEASAACRNYSKLTMNVRTLSQQVLVVYVLGISVALFELMSSRSPLDNYVEPFFWNVLFYGGIVLGVFGLSLALVNWHYQSAFTGIRNALVKMERAGPAPWTAHRHVRRQFNDFIASYAPFWLLETLGFVSFLVGAYKLGWQPLIAVIGGGVAFILAIAGFVLIGFKQGDIWPWGYPFSPSSPADR